MHSVVGDMEPWQVVVVVGACGIGSLLIGAVGIGGVIVMPALIACGVDPAIGIITVFVGFAPTALVKCFLMSRIEGMIPWRASLSAGIAAAIGSGFGGLLVTSASRQVLTCLVGGFALIAGLKDITEYVLARRAMTASSGDGKRGEEEAENGVDATRDDARLEGGERVVGRGTARSRGSGEDSGQIELELMPEANGASPVHNSQHAEDSIPAVGDGACEMIKRSCFSAGSKIPEEERWSPTPLELCILFVIGLATGLGSVLTGTGGPLIFLPIVLTWKASTVNPKTIIGTSGILAACLVIAAVTTMLATTDLRPDWGLCIITMVASLVGVTIGVRVLEMVSRQTLQLAMAVLLLAVAVMTIYQGATFKS